jgi:hypothetical protein
MRTKHLCLKVCCVATFALCARADDFQLSGPAVAEQTANGVNLNISTAGAAAGPVDQARYENTANWQVMWYARKAEIPNHVDVVSVAIGTKVQKVTLRLAGNLPSGDPRAMIWTVLFLPPREMAAVPALLTSTQLASAGHGVKEHLISPLQSGDQPDVIVSGSFLAGGNTKPIYTIQEQASLYATEKKILGFAPGFSSSLAINQGAQPPNNRTRLDPDSIQGAFSFWRIDSIQRGPLYGMTTKVDLVNGEFARSDPSANITAGFLSTLILRRKRLSNSAFFALYPALGLEGGHNLKPPGSLQGAPVDLSHYAGIFRGVAGADAIFAIAAADRMSSLFSITGTYRVRLPVTDEPFVESLHGQTVVDLTTKARHWVEVDVIYSPPRWQFLGLTAKYQFGSLPPIFSFVDQQVSLGLLFQAKQTRKPTLPPQ